jgi:alkylation response protein AidB-like acyl-CoA dehydrogenase
VDFDFSQEQKALREAVRDTLAAEAPPTYIRAMLDDERGFTDGFWRTIADLGWTGLLIPEEAGGLGLGMVDLVVLQEEMGKLPLPGPFFSSSVLATLAARRLGADELLPGLADGTVRGAVAIEEISSRDPLDGITTTAAPAGDGTWLLQGLKPVVLDGHTADWVIVAARHDTGLGGFLVESPVAEAVPTFDPTRKAARLVLDGTPARMLGAADATGALRRVLDDAAVALAAELVGCCERANELANEYAKVRHQFGRPIGSFQAIRHKAAEMLQRTELARVGAHYAAWTSETDAPDRERAAAMAKGYAAEAAIAVTGDSIQIHGGVGFTWDADVHLFYKRAKGDDLLFGQQGWQRQRVADLVVGPAGATA